MVKQCNAWKLKWFKNNDDNGGAMKTAIDKKNADDIVIHSQTVKLGRLWTHIKPAEFLPLLDKNHGLYEVISQFPHKVYFDIDKKGETDELFLEDIKQIILKQFPNAQMAISGSVNVMKKDDLATSYHIVLTNYTIHNEEERLYMRHIVKSMSNSNDAFDWKVYTPNRNMKCVNQSKDDGRIQAVIENPDFKDHCITCFLTAYPLPFLPMDEKTEIEIHIEKAHGTFDLTLLPKLNLECNHTIPYEDLTPLQIVEMMPLDNSGKYDFAYTSLVARWCFHNGLSKDIFVAWIIQKHQDYPKINRIWENCVRFPPVSNEKMRNILNYFYPKLKQDRHYCKFEDTFDFAKDNVTKIDVISQQEFKATAKYLLFNVGMGAGKTAQTIDYLKTLKNQSFCWIAPNKALAHNTHCRIINADIECIHYLEHNSQMKKEGSLEGEKNCIIVANSLHYIPTKNYDVIVIDEIETLIDKWFGDFMKNKAENWSVFKRILKQAKRVVLLDAFTTTKTLNLINRIEPDNTKIIYERNVETNPRTIVYVKGVENMIDRIIKALITGKKIFIFYPYKNSSRSHQSIISMPDFCDMLKSKTGKQGLFYNADQDEAIKLGLKNVNDAWNKQDFIITNSMITCGVNYDLLGFDEEFLFCSHFTIPRDFIQVSYRIRHLRDNKVNICYIASMRQTNCWETDVHLIGCPIYNSMTEDILIEKKTPIKKTIQLFCKKANYVQTTDKKVISDELTKQIQEMVHAYQNVSSYKNIPCIGWDYAYELEQKLFAGKATMTEKFMLNKCFYQYGFNEIGQRFEEGLDILEEGWDGNMLVTLNKIRLDIPNPNSVFQQIQKDNNMENIFPTNEKAFKDIKISTEVLEQIFSQFKFKNLTRKSSNLLILKEIYNSYFGSQIVKTKYSGKGESTATQYIFEVDYNFWWEFVKTYNYEPLLHIKPEEEDENSDCCIDI
eukprot:gene4549-9024_t